MKKTKRLYYIQPPYGFEGGLPLWWMCGKNNSGYTSNLERAKKYTLLEAKEACRSLIEGYKVWPVEHVDSKSHCAVDPKELDNNKACGWISFKGTDKYFSLSL